MCIVHRIIINKLRMHHLYIMKDNRQRFFFDNSPVRGDVVSLEKTLAVILAQRDYPLALKKLLGEMLVTTSLLASTIKIEGRLSIQLQHQGSQDNAAEPLLSWAMAECNDKGELRALAKWRTDDEWQTLTSASDAFTALNNHADNAHAGVMFINIEPDHGQRYQGIVERVSNDLAECITHYQTQSAQIPTLLKLSCNGDTAGGIMVQKLPSQTEEEQATLDDDLWPRLTALTETLSDKELIELPATDILHRLYHEEDVMLPESTELKFGCTCSHERCETALQNVGLAGVQEVLQTQDPIEMDCQFCGQIYRFNKAAALALFELPN